MHKFKRKFLIGLFLLFLTIAPANANDNFIPIRVGISNTSFNTYLFEEIEFINANTLSVMDSATGYNIPINENAQTIKVASENNLFKVYIDGVLSVDRLR